MPRRNIPAGLKSHHFEVLDVSSAASLNSTGLSADRLLISVETQSIRMRADGTAPTANTGVLLLAANSPYWLDNFNKTSDLQFIEVASAAVVNVQGFVYRS